MNLSRNYKVNFKDDSKPSVYIYRIFFVETRIHHIIIENSCPPRESRYIYFIGENMKEVETFEMNSIESVSPFK